MQLAWALAKVIEFPASACGRCTCMPLMTCPDCVGVADVLGMQHDSGVSDDDHTCEARHGPLAPEYISSCAAAGSL